jgi:hypothetical protein
MAAFLREAHALSVSFTRPNVAPLSVAFAVR